MSGSRPHRLVALLAAFGALALTAAAARADDAPPAVFGGHGVSFSYPLSWQHIQGQFQIEVGASLWSEFFAPQPVAPPPPDPNQPPPAPGTPTTPTPPATGAIYDVVAVSAYRLPIAITKKTLPRYKPSIQAAVMQLAAKAGGSMLSTGSRVAVGGLPGYRFDISMPAEGGLTLQSRIVMVFKKKLEYFFNCQSLKDGPLAAEVASGCDQVMRSFRAR